MNGFNNGTKVITLDTQDNELPEDVPTRPFALVDNSEWSEVDTGRAFGVTNTKPAPNGGIEVAEPVLRPRLRKMSRQRSDNPDDPPHEISEPLLKATQAPRSTTAQPSRRAKNYDMSTTTPTYDMMSWGERAEKEESSFAVQFLPTRLASFITRAERYARDTLLPLVSAYAPRLPIFGSREAHRPSSKYIPTETINTTAPIPTPTLEVKIQTLRSVGPPSARHDETPVEPDLAPIETTTLPATTTTTTQPTTTIKLRPAPIEMLKIVPGPVVSTTTLPPVAVRSDAERVLIVYPSNARDERKIKSHSYPEEMQFEALYRHTASPGLRVDLPTFVPPITAQNVAAFPTDSRYIPVPFQKADSQKPNAKLEKNETVT